MPDTDELLSRLRDASNRATFNTWLGLEVAAAAAGEVELRLGWRQEFGQYNGFLHAGIVAALIDTACGYAAASLSGAVLTSHFAIRCLRPAVAETFVVRARVLKPGRLQIFTMAELLGLDAAPEKLFAVGDAILVPTA